jgi:hypothetical protein
MQFPSRIDPSEGAVVGLTDRMVDAVDTLDEILRNRLPPKPREAASTRS